jgi:chromatin structure-remodeling complex subunit RSC9
MVLSLKSGIHHEVNWALDRLCRLCDNEKFHLQDLPGLIEALFEWPQWYLREGLNLQGGMQSLFSGTAENEKKTRHALLSILVLRSASLNLPNATSLAASPRTRPLILSALQVLNPSNDTHAEFLLYAIELYLSILAVQPTATLSFPAGQNPVPVLANIAKTSSNRSLAIASLSTLSLIFSDPINAPNLKANSPALDASLRFLPVFTLGDKELTEACINYLYAHLSNPVMTKTFLLHPDMPSTLRLLVMLLLSEQEEEETTVDLGGGAPLPPQLEQSTRYRVFSKQELDELGAMPEPGRAIEWYVSNDHIMHDKP